MTGLLSLSDELLLNVAFYLRYHPFGRRVAYTSLRHIALTCRRLRGAAQDVLFHDVLLLKAHSKPNKVGHTRLSLLLRSLLERQHLADKVIAFHVEALQVPHEEYESCIRSERGHGELCACGWTEMTGLVEKFIRSNPNLPALKLEGNNWWNELAKGSQPLLIGLVLRRARAIRRVSIDIWSRQWQKNLTLQVLERNKLFGYLMLEKDFEFSMVPGLANVTELLSSSLVAPDFLALPKLETLQMSVEANASWTRPQGSDVHLSQAPQQYFGITRLTLILGISNLKIAPHQSFVIEHVKVVIDMMPNLKHLYFRFNLVELRPNYSGQMQPACDYTRLISVIDSPLLESLTIDTSDINQQLFLEDTNDPFLPRVQPIKTLQHLPRLRHFTAPEPAFFSVDEHFKTVAFPPTIERIGLIDPTESTKRYAQFLFENYERWPRLKEMKLWLDENLAHLVRDERLPLDSDDSGIIHAGNDEDEADDEDENENEDEDEDEGDYNDDDYVDWTPNFRISDDVWKDVNEVGIRVTRHHRLRGWRDGWTTLP